MLSIKIRNSFFFVLCLFNFFFSKVDSKSKSVAIHLKANWDETPIVSEISEYLSEKGESYFWSYVDKISSSVTFPTESSYNSLENYELAIGVAETLIGLSELNLLKFSLSLKVHSPKVQMHIKLGEDKKPQKSCRTFVEINNVATCQIDIISTFIKTAINQTKPLIMRNDHIYPGKRNDDVIVILYGQLGSDEFLKWHNTLVKRVEYGQITYIFRHYFKNQQAKKLSLSGYGVELAIKSTEYKAKDDTKVQETSENIANIIDEDNDVQGFLFSKLLKKYNESKSNLLEFRQHLIDSTGDLAPLKVWQLQDLSFHTTQAVFNEPISNRLAMFKDLSQNFPSKARSLINNQVSDDLRKGILKNQKHLEIYHSISPGDSAIYLNGRHIDLETFDAYTFIDLLQSENRLMQGLNGIAKSYGLSYKVLSQFLGLEIKEHGISYGLDIRDSSVLFINDLERDIQYINWPESLQDLLRPSFPGHLRRLRRNLFNVVFYINIADKASFELIKTIESFLMHSAPVRLGLVFLTPLEIDDPEKISYIKRLVGAFQYISKQETPAKAMYFLSEVSAKSLVGSNNMTLTLRNTLEEKYGSAIVEEIWQLEHTTYDFEKSLDFYYRSGLGELPQALINGVPLKREEINNDFDESVAHIVLKQTAEFQKAVYNGFLKDDMDLMEYIMTRKHIVPRLNARILTNTDSSYLDFSSALDIEKDKNYSSPMKIDANYISSTLKYITKTEEQIWRPVTIWVVCDLTAIEGQKFFSFAFKHLKRSNNIRLGIIHNSEFSKDTILDNKNKIPLIVQTALETLSLIPAKNFITKLFKEENLAALQNGEKTIKDLSVGNMDIDQFLLNLQSAETNVLLNHRDFCKKNLKFDTDAHGIVVNGKILGPLKARELFLEDDFHLLEKLTISNLADKLEKKFKILKINEIVASELTMKLESMLFSQSGKRDVRTEITFAETKNSIINIPSSIATSEDTAVSPAIEMVAILDPISRQAQKFIPFLIALQKIVNSNITLFLNCRERLSEMPLKSYYRFVMDPELDFNSGSESSNPQLAVFGSMPEKPLLTLNMDPPESWLVQSVHSPHDLDNIYLEEVESRVYAEFELENILLEGHCYDLMSGAPPRGLQFVLGTNSTPSLVDTIVMANLGYFQLKAAPGLWYLNFREGRSKELYEITNQDSTDSPGGVSDVIVVIDSFKSKTIRLKVSKKPGFEHEDLLSEKEPTMGLWDSISSTLTGGSTVTVEDEKDDVLNIFSLASGHLYERLLRIMMLSVMKHTKTKVKFWFLKNYLSPTFKDFIPHMAAKYNFEFELIQYKWPKWLHQQTEKQRIIWGYKILFLDVLFPLNVNKIIFVDADQIIRADLKELRELDLEGAPYGYTPFCDSRKEMDGFRFWKTGYWSVHLGYRKYHISALYVVDLKKFRKIAAGDRLRGQYQGLSQDPNSLSNLDQDLPNNMIHQVAIKSLPQEWLWCETWCSDEEKSKAKTIDLCNNPKTKESKLTAAQRIVPEWKDYDIEVKTLWEQVYNAQSEKATEDASTTIKQEDAHVEL